MDVVSISLTLSYKFLSDLFHALYWKLCYYFILRENNITGVIDTTFAVEQNSFGVLKVHELKPGGKDEPVTEENKGLYVK